MGFEKIKRTQRVYPRNIFEELEIQGLQVNLLSRTNGRAELFYFYQF